MILGRTAAPLPAQAHTVKSVLAHRVQPKIVLRLEIEKTTRLPCGALVRGEGETTRVLAAYGSWWQWYTVRTAIWGDDEDLGRGGGGKDSHVLRRLADLLQRPA